MKLDQDDKIIGVKICKDDQDILLSTQFENVSGLNQKNWDYLKADLQKELKGLN